ncbi:MAG: hypothetical protein K2L33_01360 [Muribaculaceae bacterium]|nr:hypothetical protein [Muribaculaceae bacterium]
MTSDKYSSARMWMLTKHYFVENRRNITITCGVIFGILLLISILITKSSYTPYDVAILSNHEERNAFILTFFCMCAGLIMQILGSLTFSSMSTKSKRISNLMLPASQSEKFISQCLIYVVGGNLFLIASLLLADTVSALIFGMIPAWIQITVLMDFTGFISICPYGYQILAMIFLGVMAIYLCSQAIYVLGSAWWPRKSYLKTFVALFVFNIASTIIIPFGLLFNFFPSIARKFEDFDISIEQDLTIGWCGIVLAYVVLFVIYWLAWQRYKRLEVVKRFL